MSRPNLLLALLPLAACSTEEIDGGGDEGTPVVELYHDPLPLPDEAWQAVEAAPDWLQDDLAINLGRLDEEEQLAYAELLLAHQGERIYDELAFTVAHLSPEVLGRSTFYPELLVQNAELVYDHDAELDYVRLEDVGTPGADAGYYTTAVYRVGMPDGSVEEHTLDRDLYYWYVVHPRLEDELPYFVDGWTSGDPVSPDEGYFWREFLWDRAADECPADRDCPLLEDRLQGVDTLWNHHLSSDEDYDPDSNGALSALIRYVQDALEFGAGDERPVQPNRIYAVMYGNCGEHADLSCAAARTVLVPCQNVGARANDHTWNEFYDQGWVEWEPIASYVGHFTYYVDENGDYHRNRNRVDDDCDGVADEGTDTTDQDGDGFSPADGDCDDTDPSVHPGAAEVADGVDQDCDGLADQELDAALVDADGDGYTVAGGDCNDLDAGRHPGAAEVADGVDQDCDGLADQGLEEDTGYSADEDADGDSYTVADGDCDDTDPSVHPGAAEVADGVDQDCDGLADQDLDPADIDRDGDGYTVAEGDCDDTSASRNPGEDDPQPSSNRLYAITDTRGDTYISTDRTVDYATPAYLDFHVTDDDFNPVDGAIVVIYGTWAVYGYDDYLAWAAEAVTDLDGYAHAVVGEANPYYFDVDSPMLGFGEEDHIERITSWSEPGETYEVEGWAEGEMPSLELEDWSVPGDVAMILGYSFQVESYRVEGDGAFSGSFSKEFEGGRVDAFVTDADGLAALEAGEPVHAIAPQRHATGADVTLELPYDRPWYVVLANLDTWASTMVGTLSVEAEAAEGHFWDAGPGFLEDYHFIIPPGEYLAISIW